MKGTSCLPLLQRGTMSITTTERAVLPTVATRPDTESHMASCINGDENNNNVWGFIADSAIPPLLISVTYPQHQFDHHREEAVVATVDFSKQIRQISLLAKYQHQGF